MAQPCHCVLTDLKGVMSKADAHCVLLADRHHRLMEGVRGLLETEFDVVVMVSDEKSLCEGATRMKPGVILVDLSLAQGDGLGLVRRLRDRLPEVQFARSRRLQPAKCESRNIRSRG